MTGFDRRSSVRPTDWAKLDSRPGGRFANVKLRCPDNNKTSPSLAILCSSTGQTATGRRAGRPQPDSLVHLSLLPCAFLIDFFRAAGTPPSTSAFSPLPTPTPAGTTAPAQLQQPLFSLHNIIHRAVESVDSSLGRLQLPALRTGPVVAVAPTRNAPSPAVKHFTTPHPLR
ncbi:uncharacterized protein CC84DRAFT_756074 [Paraphaeosphaeria sporulosa]|uniref:Uncharacterized protein n=1 Tax=Paraphaeosphaeria sporulosa TaxID=1460663 RepID=A0A177CG09_9PLEO|nr:uncharacterized protein CC84DRAFT_756074 [Paraphaeosphaeria sporulosa]OAG06256.1 hypothetical protein CC84DRAFT_756074 [Paraphaeosphaeria sporulosa]